MLQTSEIIGTPKRDRGTIMSHYSEAVRGYKVAEETGETADMEFYKAMKSSLMEEMKKL